MRHVSARHADRDPRRLRRRRRVLRGRARKRARGARRGACTCGCRAATRATACRSRASRSCTRAGRAAADHDGLRHHRVRRGRARARAGMDMVVTDHHRPAETLPACPVVHPSVCGYPAELCATGVAYKFAQALYRAAGRDLARARAAARPRRTRDGRRPRAARGREPRAREAGPACDRRHFAAGAARAAARDGGGPPERHRADARLRARAPHQRGGAPLSRGRRAGAGAHARRGPRARDRARARCDQHRAPVGGDARSCSRPSGCSRSRASPDPAARPTRSTCSPTRTGIPGVIGIVASRLVDRYHRPFVMVAMSESGEGRGSGRSIRPYDLHAGLAASADHLEGFGGHRMAAGLAGEGRAPGRLPRRDRGPRPRAA